MKAFLIGIVFLIAAGVFIGLGYLLLPFLLVMGLVLRFILIIVFLIVAVWALGKFIIFVWEALRKK